MADHYPPNAKTRGVYIYVPPRPSPLRLSVSARDPPARPLPPAAAALLCLSRGSAVLSRLSLGESAPPPPPQPPFPRHASRESFGLLSPERGEEGERIRSALAGESPGEYHFLRVVDRCPDSRYLFFHIQDFLSRSLSSLSLSPPSLLSFSPPPPSSRVSFVRARFFNFKRSDRRESRRRPVDAPSFIDDPCESRPYFRRSLLYVINEGVSIT